MLPSTYDNAPRFISGHDKTREATNSILDEGETRLTLEIAPSDLISSIRMARTTAQRLRIQARFNDLLRKAVAETAKETDLSEIAYVNVMFNYAGGYSLGFLKAAARNEDPIVREQAIRKFPYADWAIDELNGFLRELDKHKPRPRWAADLTRMSKQGSEAARPPIVSHATQ